MAYERKTWLDKNPDGTIPPGAIPFSASNLNRMEAGIEEAINTVNIGEFIVNGSATVNLGYKPRYLTAMSNSGTSSFTMFQNTLCDYCTITDNGFVVVGVLDITENISEYFDVINNSKYFFEYDTTTKQFASNNNLKGANNTIAETSLRAKKDISIQFTYGYSTESSTSDQFYISLLDNNGNVIYYLLHGEGGAATEETCSVTVKRGQYVSFEYEKDHSIDKGLDQCYFKNVKIIGSENGNWSYMAIR